MKQQNYYNGPQTGGIRGRVRKGIPLRILVWSLTDTLFPRSQIESFVNLRKII